MKRPRFSIGGLMIVVGVVAAEIAFVQDVIGNYRIFLWESLALFTPMVTILIFGLVRLLRRGRSAAPFLFGFEVCGWAAVVLWFLAYDFGSPFFAYFNECVEPLLTTTLSSLGLSNISNLQEKHEAIFWIVRVPIILIGVTLPPLILAVIGGWLTRRFQRRRLVGPETKAELRTDVGLVPGSTPP